MLDPRDRSLLLECLRTPMGHALDKAVGTTFSLDLLALLTAPLAFTFFDWEDEDGRITADPLALLEAVRRHARRIRIFCQAGEIKVPDSAQKLTAWLEQSVIPVAAPKGGVFHPKIWVIRYVPADQGPVRMRLLCLSRNLTFDRSWDTALVLEGQVEDRRNAIAQNHPLADFVAALPGLAIMGMDSKTSEEVGQMAEELRRVRWDLPEKVRELCFWPLGISTSRQWPFKGVAARRPMLVVSPFVEPGFLNTLEPEQREIKLISRPDTLAGLPPEVLARLHGTWAIDPSSQDPENDMAAVGSESGLSGLHAKIFVADDGWDARMYLGSANATPAAFHQNVEFLVELLGAKKDLGVDAVLGQPDNARPGLLDIALPWSPVEKPPDTDQLALDQLEKKLDALKRQIASMQLHVTLNPLADGSHELHLTSDAVLPLGSGTRLLCWPAGLPRANQRPCMEGQRLDVQFAPVSTVSASAFVAFELSLSADGQTLSKSFVALARLHGAPADRFDQILATLLQDQDQLFRLLWLLLESAGAVRPMGDLDTQNGSPAFWGGTPPEGYPLFERIVRTLGSEQERLQDLGRIIEDLSRTEQGASLLHPALKNLWTALRPLLKERAA
ncbi:MAG: phospholipase D family protein [Pseudomonadota bacterium]|nr:phospholipase D family protein [Pseudomonadota bacterium]